MFTSCAFKIFSCSHLVYLHNIQLYQPILIEVAALISLGLGDYPDFGIICGLLLANACLGFREEYHAKKSLDELSDQLESEIAVRREGTTTQMNVKELVPGDVVLLVGGTSELIYLLVLHREDLPSCVRCHLSPLSFTPIHIFHSHSVVPADTQWIKGDKISVDTAALTGEPIPRKYPGEHGDIILSGTTVVAGECYGRVLKTGTNTEIGQAQADVLADKTVSIVSVFQKKIMTVVQVLVSASLVLVIAVLLVEGIKYNGFDTNWKQTILDAVSKVFFF